MLVSCAGSRGGWRGPKDGSHDAADLPAEPTWGRRLGGEPRGESPSVARSEGPEPRRRRPPGEANWGEAKVGEPGGSRTLNQQIKRPQKARIRRWRIVIVRPY